MKHALSAAAAAAALALALPAGWLAQPTFAQAPANPVVPVVFQAAGPTIAAIQGTVDAFRAALGANNGNAPGPLAAGRREINWDGGGSTATAIVPTPFDGFLVSRGARFTTPGTGFVQAPVQGLAATFANPSYADIFQAFSPVRLFSAIGSAITTGQFFVPGGGNVPARTAAFGAIFTDVDRGSAQPSTRTGPPHASTVVALYDADGRLLFSGDVPASPGDASVSFLGLLYDSPRIATVRIRSGNAAPGADDTAKKDVVMMDDFIYAEPQPIQ